MKLIILMVLVALTFSSFQSRAVAETGTYCPIAQEYLQGDALEKAVSMRAKTAKYCLICKGDRCSFNSKNMESEQVEKLCKVSFCVPTKLRKTLFSENTWTNFSAEIYYSINEKGRGELTRVEFTSGSLPRKQLAEYEDVVERQLGSTRWKPIEINGQRMSLDNLFFLVRYYTN